MAACQTGAVACHVRLRQRRAAAGKEGKSAGEERKEREEERKEDATLTGGAKSQREGADDSCGRGPS